MSKVKIKLTTHEGEDYGYLALGTGSDRKYFHGKASESDATTFIQEHYKKEKDIFYYRVDNGKKQYLDEHTRSGVVFPETPFVSAPASSIHAWKLNSDNQLEAVYGSKGTTEVLSPAHNRNQDKIEAHHPNALFCNLAITTRPFTVEIKPQ